MRRESNAPRPDRFEQLLLAAHGGSPDALGRLLQPWREYLLGLAEAEIGSDLRAKGGASDLVQDTFLEAQEAFPHFEGKSPAELRAWLRLILIHNLANFWKHYHQRDKRQVAREVPLDGGRPGAELREELEARRPSPEDEAIRDERVSRLRAAVERLPAEYRQVVYLHGWEKLSFDAVGEQLGCSAEAARKRWARALLHLVASERRR
jgi:RNA polymerase sigma-70 factor, ECF subfamily